MSEIINQGENGQDRESAGSRPQINFTVEQGEEAKEKIPSVDPNVLNIDVTPQSLIRLIYNTNPFYLISSLLVLYGAQILFRTNDLSVPTLIPVGIISAFIVLLTVTAIFIVKVGGVWNDARSIMMCILALLMILSVSVDSQTLDSFADGAMWLGPGLVFSVVILETLRRQLKIRLPGNFLFGIYTIIGLFFVYPLIVSQLILQYPDDRTPGLLAILSFPVVMALAILSWIPSAMKGREIAQNNGTPWTAPRFPWVVAGFLIICVFLRTYLLSLSFQDARGIGGFRDLETGFDLYMMIPPLFAAMILMVEYARATGSRRVIAQAVFFSFVLILLGGISLFSHTNAYRQFTGLVFTGAFNPLALGFGAAVVFYLYGWLRKLPHFDIGVSISVIVTMLICMTYSGDLRWIPAAAGLLVLGLMLIRRATPLNQVFFIGSLLLAANLCLPGSPYKAPALIHLCVLTLMGVGYFNRTTTWAKILRVMGVVLWLGIFLAGMAILPSKNLALHWKFIYPAFMCLSGIVYCLLCREKYFKVFAAIFAGCGLIGLGIYFYGRVLVASRGGQIIFWAILSFAGAVLISLHKGGILRLGRKNDQTMEHTEKEGPTPPL